MSYLDRIEDAKIVAKTFPGGLAAGANVRTPFGARRIEMVRSGDLIVTRDMGLQPVRMVWFRDVSAEEMSQNHQLAPVRLKPRAIGPMMPQTDVCLAPDHRILVPGYRVLNQKKSRSCLINARELAGSSDAAYIDRSHDVVRFYTLVFDTHQIYCVNGLPVESFLANPANISKLNVDMKHDLLQKFPQLRREPNAYPPAEYRMVRGAEYLPEYA